MLRFSQLFDRGLFWANPTCRRGPRCLKKLWKSPASLSLQNPSSARMIVCSRMDLPALYHRRARTLAPRGTTADAEHGVRRATGQPVYRPPTRTASEGGRPTVPRTRPQSSSTEMAATTRCVFFFGFRTAGPKVCYAVPPPPAAAGFHRSVPRIVGSAGSRPVMLRCVGGPG